MAAWTRKDPQEMPKPGRRNPGQAKHFTPPLGVALNIAHPRTSRQHRPASAPDRAAPPTRNHGDRCAATAKLRRETRR